MSSLFQDCVARPFLSRNMQGSQACYIALTAYCIYSEILGLPFKHLGCRLHLQTSGLRGLFLIHVVMQLLRFLWSGHLQEALLCGNNGPSDSFGSTHVNC